MSSSEFMFGYIEEDRLPVGIAAKANEEVIESLPEEDADGLPLIRSMFAIPRLNRSWVTGQDGTRAIGFALHAKVFSPGAWLPKFETLLKRLHWTEARIHVYTEASASYRDYELLYKLDKAAWAIRNSPNPRPGQTWELRCRWIADGGLVDGQEAKELGISGRPGYTTTRAWQPVPDRVRVQRILDAARLARNQVQGRTRSDLDADPILLRVLMRLHDEIATEAEEVGDEGRRRGVPFALWTHFHGPGRFDWSDSWLPPDDPLLVRRNDELWNLAQVPLIDLIGHLERTIADWPLPSPQRSDLRP